jgi:hypothetical protein
MPDKITKRENGYYWCRVKRTGVWLIAKWHQNLNNGKGFWDYIAHIENDARGGFDAIYPFPLKHPNVIVRKKRVRTKQQKRTRTR